MLLDCEFPIGSRAMTSFSVKGSLFSPALIQFRLQWDPDTMQTQWCPRTHSQSCDFGLGLAHLPPTPEVAQFSPLTAAGFHMLLKKASTLLIAEVFISSFYSRLYVFRFICYCHFCVWTRMEEDFAFISSVIVNWMNCHTLLRPRFIFCFSCSRVK